jgi:predicted MFS family arabinose efflux permease
MWVRAALLLFGIGWGANQFTPLLSDYRGLEHLSLSTVQGLFAVYAVGLVPGLLLGGPAGDKFGRRTLTLPAAVVSLVASLVLISGAHNEFSLLLGRFLAGVATGVALAAATAWVKELSPGNTGAVRAGLAVSAGFGSGPLVAALIAQWSPNPLSTAYLPHVVLMVVVLAVAWRVPETGARGGRYGFGGVRHRDFLRLVAPSAPWVFGAPTVAFAVLPGEFPLYGYGVLFAGVTAGLTLACGVVIQSVGRRMRPRRSAVTGLGAILLGLLIATGSIGWHQPVLALAAAAVLGCGYGLCLVYGLTEVARIAAPHELAGCTAVFYALTYVGFAVPYVLALLRGFWSLPVLLLALAVLAALTLVFVATGRERPALSI